MHQPLDPAAWRMLHETLSRCSFWGSDDWETGWGLDGSTWAFAGLRERLHQFREVWYPGVDTPAHDLGWFFFNLIPAGFCPVMTLEQALEAMRHHAMTPDTPMVVVY